MEATGVVIGVVSLITSAAKTYQQLLQMTTRSDDVSDIQTKILLERARFETSVQHLSRFQGVLELPPNVEPIFTKMGQMERSMNMMMDSLHTYTYQQKKASNRILNRSHGSRQDVEEHLERFSGLNKQLEIMCAELGREMMIMTHYAVRKVQEPAFMLATDYETKSAERGDHTLKTDVQDAKVLKELATSCGLLLRLRGTVDPLFAELSNQFELWKYGLDSQRFYHALKTNSRQNLRRDLVLLLYESMLQIGETIVRKSLEDFASMSIRIREAVQDLDQSAPPAETGGSQDDEKANVIQTLELVVGTLSDLLPSIVSFSRTCMALGDYTPDADDVKELLQESVKMIRPGSEALSRAAEVAKTQPDESSLTDTKSITEVFDKQATYLEKWAEKHKQDIESKLANESPAKFASVANAVERIAYYLDKLPTTVDDQLSSSGTPLEGSLDSANQESLASIMKGLETHIQLLVELEPQLESVEALPPYSKISSGPIIDIISGGIIN
ncbi:hypothetical protein FMUND_14626 [Fusarium mundagurra]|uniref:Fungal N-terminal domain-containing protein n=1 Tax=Fusarium mundagurra TaxID=1567541 RepID=A0A8H6D0H3_9HYPO|nr:hypothetical protein FMUND_14626 [Fusarium mundagurra]